MLIPTLCSGAKLLWTIMFYFPIIHDSEITWKSSWESNQLSLLKEDRELLKAETVGLFVLVWG